MCSAKRILLCVDDELLILNALRRSLRKEPYELLCAQSAADALKVLEENEVGVVLTDYRMPEMNGIELIEYIKKHYPHTVTVLLSGYADPDKLTFAGHGDGYIFKPWDDEKLRDEVLRFFEQADKLKSAAT